MRVKPRPSRKAAAAAAAAAAIPVSIDPRTKSNYRKEKGPSRGQNLEYNSWMRDVAKTLFESHLPVCRLRHHDRRHSEEASATYWDAMLPVLRTGECTKSQNYNLKEHSRVRIGRLAFTAEADSL